MSSDSDDDLPISELIKKRKLAAAQSDSKAKEIKPERKAKQEPPPETKIVKKNDEPTKRTSKPSSSYRYRSSVFYEDTEKGYMVQSLLVRWWYAINWPTEEDIGVPPPGYESLDGFKGVFVSTRTDSLGEILDLRNKETCPNLHNLSSYHASKVKELLIIALEKQIEIVNKLNDEDSKTCGDVGRASVLLTDLKSELKKVIKIDAKNAEAEAKDFNFKNYI